MNKKISIFLPVHNGGEFFQKCVNSILAQTFKNFDLNLFVYAALGQKKFNGLKWMTGIAEEYHHFHKDLLDAWSPQNTDTNIPRITKSMSNINNRESDRFLEDASFVRIKNIQLGYTVPLSITDNVGISNLRVFAGAENLLTITKYSGWDPSIGGNSSQGLGGATIGSTARVTPEGPQFGSGVDRNPYPVVRRVIFGLQVTF